MSRRALAAAIFVCLSWPAAAVAQSWTDATRVRMIKDALKISPPALRAILEHYEKDLLRGMLEPSRHENEEVHFQLADGKGGLGAVAIDQKVRHIRDMLAKREPFSTLTYEMGVLAHLVADVEFPLSASEADPREPLYRESYRLYVERILERIPFVVDRIRPRTLEKNDVRGFVREIAVRAGKNYSLIGPAFKDDGTPKSPSALDDRSVPFGIASLSYSHSTSDIVWIWKHLWSSINGDMEGTPFLEAPPPEKVSVPPRKPKRRAPPATGASPPSAAGASATPSPLAPRPTPSPSASPSVPRPAPSPSAAPSPSPTPPPRGAR